MLVSMVLVVLDEWGWVGISTDSTLAAVALIGCEKIGLPWDDWPADELVVREIADVVVVVVTL